MRKILCVFLCVVIMISSCLALVSYADNQSVFCDIEDGVLYVYGDGPLTSTFMNNISIVEVFVERGITSIPEGAFNGCTNLEKVTISNSVESIGLGAFEDCSSLVEVKLPRNITMICEYTFYGCESLKKINIPNSVTEIECGAFYNCSNLECIILPGSLETIGVNAFKNCSSLGMVYYPGTVSGWAEVNVSDSLINGKDIIYLSPEIYTEKTYSSGKMILSLRLGGGGFNALDMQFSASGDCSIYRIQANKLFASSNNRNTGMVSMVSDNALEIGDEVVKVTFNVTNCDNYSVNIGFLSCTVRVEGYDIDVPVVCDSTVVQGSHKTSGWNIVSYPSSTADGEAEASCSYCGNSLQKNLTFAFKNCAVEDNIVFLESFGVDETAFESEYFLNNSAELSASGSYVGTGSTVSVDYSDGIVLNYDVSLSGDVDSDGFCDAQDSILIYCMCENMIDVSSLSRCVALASDINKDDSVDYSDAELAALNGI